MPDTVRTQAATELMPERPRRPARLTGWAGLAGAAVFGSTVTALLALEPGLSPLNDYVSDYANGSWGALFTSVVFLHVLGNAFIYLGLRTFSDAVHPAHRWALTIFALATVGMLVAGIFKTDPIDAAPSLEGAIHARAVVGSFALEWVAVVLFAFAWRQTPNFRKHARFGVVVAVLGGITMLWFALARSTEVLPGLAERAALFTFTVWEFSLGLLLWRTSGAEGRQLDRAVVTERHRRPGHDAPPRGAARRRDANGRTS